MAGAAKGLELQPKIMLCDAMGMRFRERIGLWCRRITIGCGLGIALCCNLPSSPQARAEGAPAKEQQLLPRFASLKSDRVQLHHGPGADFPIAWVFRRAGLPVEVVQENAAWREVRDSEGTTGWVWATALSSRRTAVILPWEAKKGQSPQPSVTLRDDDREGAKPLAQVEAGVLASIIACDGHWCRVSVDGFRGYVEQAKLWGTGKGEVIK